MIEFVASGSPRALSRTIEEFAADQRLVSAIVVPWESDATNLSMAVTAVTGDGWAIEHTNLGTIRLTDLGNDRTRFAARSGRSEPPRSAEGRRAVRPLRPAASRPTPARVMTDSSDAAARRQRSCFASRKRASRTSVTPSRVSRRRTCVRIGARPGDILKITGRNAGGRAR